MDARDLRRLATAVRSGVRGVRRAPMIFALSVATMGAGLLMLSAYLLVLQNMRVVLESAGQDLSVVAFLAPGGSPAEGVIDELRAYFEALEGVEAVTFVSRAAALERLRKDLGADAALLDDLAENPLPASFEIRLRPEARTPEAIRGITASVARVEDVEDVRYGEAWVESYARVLGVLQWIGAGLGICLFVVLGVIVAGTIRLGVYARSDEIQIQRLVGAGGLFVRLPFYLEGALQGALGSSLALGLLYAIFHGVRPAAGDALHFVLGRADAAFFGAPEVGALVCLGVLLGLAGSMLSLLRIEELP